MTRIFSLRRSWTPELPTQTSITWWTRWTCTSKSKWTSSKSGKKRTNSKLATTMGTTWNNSHLSNLSRLAGWPPPSKPSHSVKKWTRQAIQAWTVVVVNGARPSSTKTRNVVKEVQVLGNLMRRLWVRTGWSDSQALSANLTALCRKSRARPKLSGKIRTTASRVRDHMTVCLAEASRKTSIWTWKNRTARQINSSKIRCRRLREIFNCQSPSRKKKSHNKPSWRK